MERPQLSTFISLSDLKWTPALIINLRAGVHLRSESEINVESWGLSSSHIPESTLGEF